MILLGVTYPLNNKKLHELTLEAGLDPTADTALVTLAKLIEMGKVPLIDKGF